MTSQASKKADRIFVQDGRRAYRRRFSGTEVRIGAVVLLALASILVWVAWKGAHPDPSLFMLETDLSQTGAVQSVARGPVPDQLAPAGWSEGSLAQFDNENLYEKIDGREGYYKSFGFERLYALSLLASDDPQIAVDIELYDLSTAANALGAYAGERAPEARPDIGETGLTHIDRNALYLTNGRFYLRAIGSDESPQVVSLLAHLRDRFQSELPSEPLPWGFAIFVGQMGMEPGSVSFAPTNAFSFGFAHNVYSARLDDNTELFVTPSTDAEVDALAQDYRAGFLQYGEEDGDLVKDRYRSTYAGARSSGAWVVGVRSAKTAAAAREELDRLANIVRATPLPETGDTEATKVESQDEAEPEHETDEH